MKIRPAAIFSFCALIFFIIFVYQAQDWRLQARLYPYAIGIPMVILAIIQVILDLRGVVRKQTDAAPVDFQFSQNVDPVLAKKRTINIFAWILGFFVGIYLLGFPITIPLLVFTYLKFQSGEKWGLSIILTAGAWLVFYTLFVKLLVLPFPDGKIFTWLGY
ncbi:MAG: tripartite tricarboxylate transporter TctB family protein [Candidatus Binatia bacterium]